MITKSGRAEDLGGYHSNVNLGGQCSPHNPGKYRCLTGIMVPSIFRAVGQAFKIVVSFTIFMYTITVDITSHKKVMQVKAFSACWVSNA